MLTTNSTLSPSPPSSLSTSSSSPTPTTLNCTPDPTSRFVNLDPAFMTYYLGSLALVIAVNVTGNLLILRTFYRHRCLWLPANVFICSLGMSDLLFAPVFFLYNVAGFNTPGIKNAFGDWLVCRILLMEVLALEICSAYTLVAITVTRFIGSKFALRFHQYVTFRNCIITVCVIWLTSHTSCITVYAMQYPQAVSSGAYCRVCRYEAIFTVRELGLLTVFQFALPFTLMLAFYLKMLCQARRLNKRVTSESFCTNGTGCQQSRATIRQRQHKSFIVIALLIGCFGLSYVPIIVYFFLIISERQPEQDYEYLSATSRIFIVFNTAVNVFIYAGRMGDFRHCLHRDIASACSFLTKCKKCPAITVSSDTSCSRADVNVVGMTSPHVATQRDQEVG